MNTVKFYFFCRAGHAGENVNRDGPTITLVAQQWAYCAHGATDLHDWDQLAPAMTLEELQAKGIAHKLVL